jgi:mannose-6-phosphate isomerase-like protein (cupin superfamily)
MPQPRVVKLAETHVHLQLHASSEFLTPDFSKAVPSGERTIIWDPEVAGLLGGEGQQSAGSSHDGERHLDGDELLYVISGALQLSLELDDGSIAAVPLKPGEAILVPRGRWHRLIVDEPSRYLFFGGGRTEVRVRPHSRSD